MRPDPIFGLPTPLLFAHRGGAREVAESTVAGFRHALQHRADVLELDVQVTADDQFVVWHGPNLDNVRLAVDDREPHARRNITQYSWAELSAQAWVADPGPAAALAQVPKQPQRQLLSLEEFLAAFPAARLNIELKRSVRRRHVGKLLELLAAHHPERIGVIASNYNEFLIEAIHRRSQFGTNLPLVRAIACRLAASLRILRLVSLKRRVLEAPYPSWITPTSTVEQVRQAGGCAYVFLSAVPFVRALDTADGSPEQKALFEILERGVDGVMTDRPQRVRQLLDVWRGARSFAAKA